VSLFLPSLAGQRTWRSKYAKDGGGLMFMSCSMLEEMDDGQKISSKSFFVLNANCAEQVQYRHMSEICYMTLDF
jgi:hypothetical protein